MPLALADDRVRTGWISEAGRLDEYLMLDLAEFSVRPMNRAMNNVRQKDIALIDPEFAGNVA